MMYWILYGVLITKSFGTTHINIYYPEIFTNVEQCLKVKEINIKKHQNPKESLNLECEKIKVEK